jgi:putative phage-type endonuclease
MIILNHEQHSEAWYEIRAGRVTGTRFATLVSGEGTKGYKDLVADIACEIITGVRESGYVTADMENGTLTEPFAREWYIDNVQPVREVGFVIPGEDDEFHEWVGVSPDGLGDNYGLEIKCPKARTLIGYIEADKIPSEYKHQVQGSLFVTGYEYWDFMAYVPGMKPFLIRAYPDQAIFDLYVQRLQKLIKDVEGKLKTYENYNTIF